MDIKFEGIFKYLACNVAVTEQNQADLEAISNQSLQVGSETEIRFNLYVEGIVNDHLHAITISKDNDPNTEDLWCFKKIELVDRLN